MNNKTFKIIILIFSFLILGCNEIKDKDQKSAISFKEYSILEKNYLNDLTIKKYANCLKNIAPIRDVYRCDLVNILQKYAIFNYIEATPINERIKYEDYKLSTIIDLYNKNSKFPIQKDDEKGFNMGNISVYYVKKTMIQNYLKENIPDYLLIDINNWINHNEYKKDINQITIDEIYNEIMKY